MDIPAQFTAIVLLIGIVLYASARFRLDFIALSMLLTLYLGGVLTAGEALSGFSAPATITLGGMYVISGAMRRSGTTAIISQQLLRLGGRSPKKLPTLLFSASAGLSGVMPNLATMVIMLPVGLRLGRSVNLKPGKMLMPLGLFAILGGYVSLLGTSPNLVISDLLAQSTGQPLGLFEPALVAIPVIVLSLAWVILLGQRLLPNTGERPTQIGPNLRDLERTYELEGAFYRLRVRSSSDLAGFSLEQLDLRKRWRVNVVGVARPGGHPFRPWPDVVLEINDEIIVQGKKADVLQMAGIHKLAPKDSVSFVEVARLSPADMEMAEVLIPPYSPLLGQTLTDLNFGERYHLNVLVILRGKQASAQSLRDSPLQVGDRLLVEGDPERLDQLREGAELVVLSDLGVPADELISKRSHWMLYILAGVVLLSALDILPLPMAALMGALAAVLTGCTTAAGAYEDADWSILVFVAALLPLGAAIENSGLTTYLSAALSAQFGAIGPHMALALVTLTAALLTQVLANTVVGLVMAPIAFDLAQTMGVSPKPFALALLLAVSAAFLTPFTEIINILVRKPGGYRLRDYLLLNTPVLIIVLVAAIWLTPLIWPF
jgi:di/tricarboxylate transporter